jgi:hypothetical protein
MISTLRESLGNQRRARRFPASFGFPGSCQVVWKGALEKASTKFNALEHVKFKEACQLSDGQDLGLTLSSFRLNGIGTLLWASRGITAVL